MIKSWSTVRRDDEVLYVQVDMSVIEDWCRREGHSQKFGLVASRIGAST